MLFGTVQISVQCTINTSNCSTLPALRVFDQFNYLRGFFSAETIYLCQYGRG